VTDGSALDRDDVLAILAAFRTRPPEEIPERIDSMELAWLVHQVEQRYGIRLDLDDGQLGRMGTVSGAVDVLREAMVTVENG
jgi:acyl carrier protein